MTVHDFARQLLIAAATILICATPLHAQTAPGSLWAKVPPLPTACYSEDDAAYNRLTAMHDSVQVDHYRQSDINAAIDEQARNVDRMEVARRMQEAMLRDPQNAQKYLGAMHPSAAQEQTQEAQALLEEDNRIRQEESVALVTRYDAAFQKARGPGNARWAVLRKKLGLGSDAMGPGESGVPDWAWTEWHEILQEWDRAYQANCPAWFGAGGQIPAFLKRYKDFLMQKWIPQDEENDKKKLATYKIYNTPATGYKSVATHAAIEHYLELAQKLYGARETVPRCPNGKCTA